MGSQSRVANPILHPFLFLYQLIQWLADIIFSPTPPRPSTRLGRPKIAVIGAGITGVSAASHCIGHGFDVVIFEAGSKDNVGGIWTVRMPLPFSPGTSLLSLLTWFSQKVNNTSSLQIHSLMFRFHPSVKWEKGYPDRQQIISQVRDLWERYGLDTRTRFNTKVERVYQDEKGRWIINNQSNGRFDGVISAIGTCGEPKMPKMTGMDKFQGSIYHSSDLTG